MRRGGGCIVLAMCWPVTWHQLSLQGLTFRYDITGNYRRAELQSLPVLAGQSSRTRHVGAACSLHATYRHCGKYTMKGLLRCLMATHIA